MAEKMKAFGKARLLVDTISNWPLVVLDKGGLAKQVHYKTRTGLSVHCRGRSTDINEAVVVLSGKEYARELLGLRDGDTVLDAGANIGTFCMLMSDANKAVSFSGYAIEPLEDNLKMLRMNLEANRLSRWVVAKLAITEKDGTVRLNTRLAYDAIAVDEAGDTEVPSARLSTFCLSKGLDTVSFLKMDIEGAEYEVLGADADFIQKHVQRAFIEYHPHKDRGFGWIKDLFSDSHLVMRLHGTQASGVLFMSKLAAR